MEENDDGLSARSMQVGSDSIALLRAKRVCSLDANSTRPVLLNAAALPTYLRSMNDAIGGLMAFFVELTRQLFRDTRL